MSDLKFFLKDHISLQKVMTSNQRVKLMKKRNCRNCVTFLACGCKDSLFLEKLKNICENLIVIEKNNQSLRTANRLSKGRKILSKVIHMETQLDVRTCFFINVLKLLPGQYRHLARDINLPTL